MPKSSFGFMRNGREAAIARISIQFLNSSTTYLLYSVDILVAFVYRIITGKFQVRSFQSYNARLKHEWKTCWKILLRLQ